MSTPITTQDYELQIHQRCRRMPAREKATLIRILSQLSALDQQLTDLHLFLPVVDVRFYGLGEDMLQTASLSPDKLLELIAATE